MRMKQIIEWIYLSIISILWRKHFFLDTELETVNQGLNDNDSDKVQTQQNKVLKQALSLQLLLQQTRAEMESLQNSSDPASSSSDNVEDHSFDHFVDYRSLAEFESH